MEESVDTHKCYKDQTLPYNICFSEENLFFLNSDITWMQISKSVYTQQNVKMLLHPNFYVLVY